MERYKRNREEKEQTFTLLGRWANRLALAFHLKHFNNGGPFVCCVSLDFYFFFLFFLSFVLRSRFPRLLPLFVAAPYGTGPLPAHTHTLTEPAKPLFRFIVVLR